MSPEPMIEALWRFSAAARRLGVSVWRLRRVLRTCPEIPVRYERDGKHPRRVRVLTTSDLVAVSRMIVEEVTARGRTRGQAARVRRSMRTHAGG